MHNLHNITLNSAEWVFNKKPYVISNIFKRTENPKWIFMVVYGLLLNNYIVNIKRMMYNVNVKNGAKLEQWTLQKLNVFYAFRPANA